MNLDQQLLEEFSKLDQDGRAYMIRLVFLMKHFPAFETEIAHLSPNDCGAASPEQLAETGRIMDRYLSDENWAEKLRFAVGKTV